MSLQLDMSERTQSYAPLTESPVGLRVGSQRRQSKEIIRTVFVNSWLTIRLQKGPSGGAAAAVDEQKLAISKKDL